MTLRFGVIGTGAMAAAMMPAMRLSREVDVVAVASGNDARARAFAETHGIRDVYGEAGVMLREQTIDAVYIANATGKHSETAIAALLAGKHVLCEKPFALTAVEGEKVLAAARESGKLFMEGLWTHFLPAYQRVHALVRDAAVGEPKHLTAAYGYPTTPELRPRLFRRDDGGVLLDVAVYPISLALRLLGPVADVTAIVTRNQERIDTDAAIQLRHENGGVSQLSASFDTLTSNTAVLSGRRGAVTIPAPVFGAEQVIVETAAPRGPADDAGASSKFKAALKQVPILRKLKSALGGGEHHPYGRDQYLPQLTHFLSLIAAGKTESDIASHALSLDTLRVLDRIREQE
ncbi:MAG: Gfo/Idh/MocA family oxidoreductase [Pseudomonadota bacterium]